MVALGETNQRQELLEGELIVAASPNRKHQRVVGNFYAFLRRAQEQGWGEVCLGPFDVVFDRHNAPQPDLLFISRERLAIITADNVQGAPDLVVEVLPHSTRRYDLGRKLRLYAARGVRYSWIADPNNDTIRVLELEGGAYVERATLRGADRLDCPLSPGLSIRAEELFV